MATITRLSDEEYQALALSDPDHNWELWDGVLVEKPLMSMKHDNVAFYLGLELAKQLDRSVFRVNVNGGKTRFPRTFFIPDVVVIPATYQLPYEDDPRSFNAFAEPLPFVAEVWSRSTGDYDMAAKLPIYRDRGDHEIWFIHPYERTLTTWRIRPEGGYREDAYRGGVVAVESLPAVSIDFDALLDG
ncbi:MAG: Uma2 family endonuclease [Thermomicrobiales bacterium]